MPGMSPPVSASRIRATAGPQLIGGTGMNLSQSVSASTKAGGAVTSRINIVPAASADDIILVYGNYINIGGGEALGASTLSISAALEYPSNGVTLETGDRVRVTAGGVRTFKVPPDGLVFTDPAPFSAVAGTPLMARTQADTQGANYSRPYGRTAQGGTGPGSLNNGEGEASNNNVLDVGAVGAPTQVVTSVYGPSAILGYSPTYIASAAIVGDSIAAGQGDGGFDGSGGGYIQRALSAQTSSIVQQYPVTPLVPFVSVACPGETLTSWASPANSFKRRRLAELATTIICEYGINDFRQSKTLAAVKSLLIADANLWISRGKHFVACTLLPYTTSTDGWKTLANQTTTSAETSRAAFNSWLRDNSAAGFVAQTSVPSLVAVFDAAAAIEVNAAGALTLNGGFWPAALNAGAALVTGTATAANAGAVVDSSKSFTQDAYRGQVVRFTSGVATGLGQTAFYNDSTKLGWLPSLSSAPAVGDTFEVYQPYTPDGLHPSSLGHLTISQALPISLVK